MAQLEPYGATGDTATTSQTEIPVQDKDLPAYKYARALCEAARPGEGSKAKTDKSNWEFFRGKNQWQVAGNTVAKQIADNSFRGVVNWCYSVIKTKAAMICGAPADVFCDPLDDQSTYLDRLQVRAVIEDDLARLNFKDVKRDAYISGSVTGVGVSMMTLKPDPLTGAMTTVLCPVKSADFNIDPSADSTRNPYCRFVTLETDLDMSTIRQMWPSKAAQVKPDVRQVTGGFTYKPDRTDDNLIYGTAGEFTVDKQGRLNSRKARVSFVWIKEEELIEDLHEVLIKEPMQGYQCSSCGAMYEPDVVPDLGPCPHCGGPLENADLPAKYKQETIVRKKYPYGRLIVYSGQTLLFDGDNPYEIETVFPFAVYQHDRIPGDFRGENDVALLWSLQEEQNRTVGQLIDYVRLAVNAPTCYPVDYTAISQLGNGPNVRLPGPNRLSWMPFRLSPQGFDVQSWGALSSSLTQHFQVVSGLAQSLQGPSSPPISATEAEISNARLSDRMKGHAQEFSTYLSEVASLDNQLLRQAAEYNAKLLGESYGPTNVSMTMPDSTVKAVAIEVQKLPKVNVRVVIDTDISVKDKLQGQNLLAFTTPGPNGQSGMDSPYADVVLGKLGFSDAEIKEYMNRRGLQEEILKGQAANQPPPPPEPAPPQPAPVGGM